MANSIKSKPLILLIVVASSLINYLLIDKTQEQASNNFTKHVHTPQEWLQLYTCNESEQLNQSPINTPFPSRCRRDPAAWRYKYIEEYGSSDLLIREESIDERLANIIYTTTTTKWTNTDHFKFNSGSWRQDEANKAAVVGPQVDIEKCSQHLNQMNTLIEDLESRLEQRRKTFDFHTNLDESHLRPARVLDSFGRYESGFLVSGKSHSVGSYEDCTRGQLLFGSTDRTDEETVRTRFCWARLKADEHLDRSLKLRKKSSFDDQENSILTGICIPETCHSIGFTRNKQPLQKIVDSQFRLPKSIYINETLELESIFCLSDEGSSFSMPLAGQLLLTVLVGWIGLALYATLRDNSDSSVESSKKHWTKALNLMDSWRDFAELNCKPSVHVEQRPVEMDALNIIKVFSSLMVVLGHSYVISLSYSSDYLKTAFVGDTSDVLASVSLSATYLVDTFFTLTSFIISYFSFKFLAKRINSMDGKNWRSRLKLYASFCSSLMVNRYLRLVPMFVIFHWFKKFVLLYIGSGPLWDYGFNRDTSNGACRLEESWLVPFTFWSAFLPLTKQCMLQSWSISNDIFFSILLGPLIVSMYNMNQRRAIWTSLAISSISIVAYNLDLALKTTAQLHYELQDIGKMVEMRYMTIASRLYTWPLYRLASISIGTLGGYYLTKFGDKNNNMDRERKLLRGPFMLYFALTVSVPFVFKVSMPTIRRVIGPYQTLIQFIYPLVRLLWTINNVVLFVRLTTDWRETTIVKLFTGQVGKMLSKLNYMVLLIHVDLLMLCHYFAATRPSNLSNWLVIATSSYVYMLTIPLSVFMHVIFENPINKLVKCYL